MLTRSANFHSQNGFEAGNIKSLRSSSTPSGAAMDTLTSFLLNEDSALAFDSFNENVLQNLPHEAGQWDILDPLVPFADTSKYSAGLSHRQCCALSAPVSWEE